MKTQYRIILASIAGIIGGGILVAHDIGSAGGDAGIIFLPFALFYGLVLAVLFVSLEELLFGKPKNKKIAAICLLVWLIWAFSTHLNHLYGSDNKNRQHYCDGVPVEQYRGTLPGNCRY